MGHGEQTTTGNGRKVNAGSLSAGREGAGERRQEAAAFGHHGVLAEEGLCGRALGDSARRGLVIATPLDAEREAAQVARRAATVAWRRCVGGAPRRGGDGGAGGIRLGRMRRRRLERRREERAEIGRLAGWRHRQHHRYVGAVGLHRLRRESPERHHLHLREGRLSGKAARAAAHHCAVDRHGGVGLLAAAEGAGRERRRQGEWLRGPQAERRGDLVARGRVRELLRLVRLARARAVKRRGASAHHARLLARAASTEPWLVAAVQAAAAVVTIASETLPAAVAFQFGLQPTQ
eukprot:scaffold105206_cov37-Phaeocystis_antarctica.AAC.2